MKDSETSNPESSAVSSVGQRRTGSESARNTAEEQRVIAEEGWQNRHSQKQFHVEYEVHKES